MSKFKDQQLVDGTTGNLDKQTELIYNCILFDEFLMELSAILLEQSILMVDGLATKSPTSTLESIASTSLISHQSSTLIAD